MGRGRNGILIQGSKSKKGTTTFVHWGPRPNAIGRPAPICPTPHEIKIAQQLTPQQLAYVLFNKQMGRF